MNSAMIISRLAMTVVAGAGAFALLSEDSHRRRVLKGAAAGQRGGQREQPGHHTLESPAFKALGSPADPAKRSGILATVGNTPLVEAESLREATGCRILLKMEDRNPGGSVKDRAALFMIEDLENRGLVKPGVTTITEGTGGNTGIGLALVAKAKGLKLKLAMPKTIAQEKIQLMRALGAEVILCNPVAFTDTNHYFHVARRLADDNPDHVFTNQFENLWNGAAHYYGTAPEIWEQTNGQVDGFVCAAGTGGTINGVSNYLKEKNPNVKAYLVDPHGSGLYRAVVVGEEARRQKKTLADGSTITVLPRSQGGSVAEGIGIDRLTANFANARVDGAFQCTDRETVEMAYFLQSHDGIFIGPSAALNVVGAVKLARLLGPGHTIVTVACDNGTRYMSKLYTSDWIRARGLEPQHTHDTSLSWIE